MFPVLRTVSDLSGVVGDRRVEEWAVSTEQWGRFPVSPGSSRRRGDDIGD